MLPIMLIISFSILLTSKGKIIFKQTRVTRYCNNFTIYKFRTMREGCNGSSITTINDCRVTKIGAFLRKSRLDELPQLFNVLKGDMSFVGPRPEVPKYVVAYSKEMYATLLVKAGITCQASIKFKNEASMLADIQDVDAYYVKEILPIKMKYNLRSIKRFNLFNDFFIIITTFFALFSRSKK